MKKIIFAAALLLATSTAFAAESIKATVRHMCCGACKAAATEGLKRLEWADNIAIDGTTITVTAKADQKPDVVGFIEALDKSGFPPREIAATGPVTLTITHLCCGGCVADLKAQLGEIRSQVLDKQNIKIDAEAKTVTLQPLAGQTLNLVAMLNQLKRTGFSASKGTMATAPTASVPRSRARLASKTGSRATR